MRTILMSRGLFVGLVIAEAVALHAVAYPKQFRLDYHAFHDQGSTLTADWLVASGERPAVDFNYLYGCGSIALGRLVYGLFGRIPETFVLCTSVIGVLSAGLMASCVWSLGAGAVARLLTLAAVPLWLSTIPVLSFAHAGEALFLTAALHEHVRGRFSIALAFAVLAVFFKPSIGYLYGLVLLVDLACTAYQTRSTRLFARSIVLPAAVAIACLVGFGLWFGADSVFRTLVPTAAVSVYEREGFGLFGGAGRQFVYFPGVRPAYYLGTPAGFWLAGTAVLACLAIRHLAVPVEAGSPSRRAGAICLCCTAVHLAFACFLYGGPWSWSYSFNFLLVGLIAGTAAPLRWPWVGRAVLAGLALLAATGTYTQLRSVAVAWRTFERVNGPGRLYAPPDDAREWERLREIGQARRVFVFTALGGTFLLDPQLDSSRAWCLYWWMPTDRERQRVIDQIRDADVVAIPHSFGLDSSPNYPTRHPPFADELKPFTIVEQWGSFEIRSRPAGAR